MGWDEETEGEMPFVTDDPDFSEESLMPSRSVQ